jgi:DNA-binding CsgD family transcriptional regulator
MNRINITRPSVTENYTVLPNDILNFGRHIQGLKPRDSAVLNYLLSRPPHWKLRANDIARAINISINTVYAALSKLRQLGFASFTRDKTGHTFWIISLHKVLSSPVSTPHTKKPREVFCDDLINTESLVNNKTTTSCVYFEEKSLDIDIINSTASTPVIESAQEVNQILDEIDEIELPIELVSYLSEMEQVIAKKTIRKSQVDSSTYNVILLTLKTALLKGNVKSPIAYLNGLISKAKNGTLHTNANSLNKLPLTREQEIKDLVARYGEKLLSDIVYRGFITNEELGYVSYGELKTLGLISNTWAKKYDDYQLEKLNQLAVNFNISSVPKRSGNQVKQKLSESEFESKRAEMIAKAMDLVIQG